MERDERSASRQLGYLTGDMAKEDETPSPSLYAINTNVSSLAVWFMMRFVSGDDQRVDGISFDALAYETKPWVHPKGTNANCPVCGENGIVGLGDEMPLFEPLSKASLPAMPRTKSVAAGMPNVPAVPDNGCPVISTNS